MDLSGECFARPPKSGMGAWSSGAPRRRARSPAWRPPGARRQAAVALAVCGGPSTGGFNWPHLDEASLSAVTHRYFGAEVAIPLRGHESALVPWELCLGCHGAVVGCDCGVMEIELADAVAALRDELIEAVGRGVGSSVGFVVGPIELEFGVELKADVKVKSGFKAWVVSADVEGGVSRGRTHRVKVTLTPQDENGQDLRVGANTVRRSGVAVDRIEG